MGKQGQTPGTWLKGGAGGLWSQKCRDALIACGINPENFGDYDARAKAQEKVRADYREERIKAAKATGKNKRPHEPNCPTGANPKKLCQCIESDAAVKDLGIEKWMLGNSQSGHISQNALYQSEGERGNPCANIPPDSNGKNAGTYGYQDNKAFCMDHLGRSSKKGTVHYGITRREERFAEHLANSGLKVVTPKQFEQGVEGTASIAGSGASAGLKGNDPHAKWDKPPNASPEAKAEAQRLDKHQEAYAAKLKQEENKKKRAKASGRGKGKKPNRPSAKGPTKAQVKKAVECIKDAWKQSLDEMRDNVINEHSTVSKSAACKKELKEFNKTKKKGEPKAKGYMDLPPDRRKKVDEAMRNDKTVEKRQKELEKLGAHDNGKGKSKKPTKKECLEYQANWLYQNKKANGTYPPMQGRVADSSSTSTTTTGTSASTRR